MVATNMALLRTVSLKQFWDAAGQRQHAYYPQMTESLPSGMFGTSIKIPVLPSGCNPCFHCAFTICCKLQLLIFKETLLEHKLWL